MNINYIKITILLFIYCLSLNIFASNMADGSDCYATVKQNSAVFIINNQDGNDNWVWFKNSTPDNQLEYQWSVTLGNINKNGQFVSTGNNFGFNLFKYPGYTEKMGNLAQLISNGQSSAWKTSNNDVTSKNEMIKQAIIKAGLYNEYIMLGVKDPRTFSVLFNNKPNAALINAFLPAINKQYDCKILINYESS